MISLDYRDSRPLYQQVKDNLRRMMLTGLLPPDEKLPSVRSLATQRRIRELKTQAAPLLEELKTLGCTEEDLLQLWRGGETHA